MNTAQFSTAHLSAKSDQERQLLENQYSAMLLNATEFEQSQLISDISDCVSKIKTRLIELKDYQNSVVTVKDYCKQQKVSRQYVNQEIKSGKFKTIELPIFTEYKGKKVAVGTQKFLSF